MGERWIGGIDEGPTRKLDLLCSRIRYTRGNLNNSDLQKLSTSICLTIFPNHLGIRDLWDICTKCGKQLVTLLTFTLMDSPNDQ